MKKFLSVLMLALSVGLTAVPFDVEAKRLGGSRSLGMKRQATPPPTTPKQAPSTTNANTPAAGTAAAAASNKSRWLGPLAGLAAGLGLAALASSLGLGEGFGTLLLVLLLVGGAVMLSRMFTRQRGGLAMAGQAAGSGQGQRFNQQQGSPLDAFRQAAAPASGGNGGHGGSGFQGIGAGLSASGLNAQPSNAGNIPAGFDTESFERQAKVNFIRLQAANDAGDLQDLKAFTTPEMYAEFEMDIRDRKGATQTTEVLDLNAQVFEVVEEGALYIASVRFTGQLREDGATAGIDEVWHLTKPINGGAGWMLAGIQQAS